MRTWERGAGLTKACGSAACAAAVCGARTRRTGRHVTVTVPGGPLDIEWREDDHVIMTGPAEWEFSGRFDPATGAWERESRGGAVMGLDIVTFGCRLNTYESEVMRREAQAAGLDGLAGGAVVFNTCAVTGEAVRQARQAIRKARRENPDGAHRRHRLRGADRSGLLRRRWTRSTSCSAIEEKLAAHHYRALARFRRQRHRKGPRQRHHVA